MITKNEKKSLTKPVIKKKELVKKKVKKVVKIVKAVEVQKTQIKKEMPMNNREVIIEHFFWESLNPLSKSGKHIVEVYNSEEKLVVREIIDKALFNFKTNTLGSYKIKVSQFYKDKLISYGEKNFTLEPPKNLNPKIMDKYVMKYVPKGKCYKVDLPSYTTASKYFVEIYRDYEMKYMVREIWSNQSEYCWRSSRDGRYYFRYKYFDFWGGSSRFSTVSEIIFPISPMTNF